MALARASMTALLSRCVASAVSGVILASSAIWPHLTARYAAISLLSLTAVSRHASAYTTATAISEGNLVGRNEASAGRAPTTNSGLGTITLRGKPSVDGTTFTVDQLFYGSTTPGNASLLSNASGTYGSMPSLSAESGTQTSSLMSPTNNVPWANAYKTLRQSAITNRGITDDLRSDPAASNIQAIASSTDPNNFLSGMDSSCTTTNVVTPGSVTHHFADIRTCDRYVGPSGCTITRNIQGTVVGPTPVFSANGYLADGQSASFELGLASSNGWCGYSGFYDAVAMGCANDGVGMAIGFAPDTDPKNFIDVNASASFSYATEACTYTISSSGNFNISQMPTALNSWVIVVSGSNGSSGIQPFSFTVSQICGYGFQESIEDFPPGCSTSSNCGAQSTGWSPPASPSSEEMASTSEWECVDARDQLAEDGTWTIPPSGASIGPIVGEPFGPGIPVCYRFVARNYVCNLPPETPNNTCDHLVNNPACSLVYSQCLNENYDFGSNQCMFMTDSYDCGYDYTVDTSDSTNVTTCSGPVRCMGDSCIEEPPPEVNDDFYNAALQLSVVQWADFDKDCGSSDCVLFSGQGHTCKVVFWGVQDCCDTPTGVNMADYIKAAFYTYKAVGRENIVKFADATGLTSSGAWQELAGWTSNTYSTISKPIVSAWESLSSRLPSADLTSGTLSAIWEPLAEQVLGQLRSWTASQFGSTVATQLWGSGSVAAFQEAIIGEAMGFIASVYMYYQLFVLAVSIIYACDQQELELAHKKELRACHWLGRFCARRFLGVCYQRKDSYCCFKSPFARIIQQQVRAQIGGWPSASATPNCSGLTLAQLGSVNWAAIDLTEWLAILQQTNLIAAGGVSADAMYSASQMTSLRGVSGYYGANTPTNTTQATAGASATNSNFLIRSQLWGGLP